MESPNMSESEGSEDSGFSVINSADSFESAEESEDEAKLTQAQDVKRHKIGRQKKVNLPKASQDKNFRDNALIEQSRQSLLRFRSNCKYTHVSAYRTVMEKIEIRNVVLLTGRPGDGKTTAGYKCLSHLAKRRQMTPLIVNQMHHLDTIYPNSNMAILIDGILDVLNISVKEVRDIVWSISNIIPNETSKNSNILLIVIQKETLNMLQENFAGNAWISQEIVVDFSFEHLSKADKIRFLENIIGKKDSDRLDEDTGMEDISRYCFLAYPECCKQLRKKEMNAEIHRKFSLKQTDMLKNHFQKMDNKHFLILAVLAINGKTHVSEILDMRPSRPFVQKLAILCGTQCDESIPAVMLQTMRYFKGVYINLTENVLALANSFVRNAIANLLFRMHPVQYLSMCFYEDLARMTNRKNMNEISDELECNANNGLFVKISEMELWKEKQILPELDKRLKTSIQKLTLSQQACLFSCAMKRKNLGFIQLLKTTMHEHCFIGYDASKGPLCYTHCSTNETVELILRRSLPYLDIPVSFTTSPSCGTCSSAFSSLDVLDFKTTMCFSKVNVNDLNEPSDTFSPAKRLTHTDFMWIRLHSYSFLKYLLETGIQQQEIRYIEIASNCIDIDTHGWFCTFLEKVRRRSDLNLSMTKGIGEAVCNIFVRSYRMKFHFIQVWAGYSAEARCCDYTFDTIVAITRNRTEEKIRRFLELGVVMRDVKEFSEEARELLKHDNDYLNKDSIQLSYELSNSLLGKHSNITLISASGVRSKGFHSTNSKLENVPCIVIYCRVKGIIPIGETQFPTKINEQWVDIREGACSLAENHEPLRFGDEIGPEIENTSGTLGGFVELEDSQLGFITCAHVLYSNEILKREDFNRYVHKTTINVQVVDQDDEKSNVGVVEKASFKHSDSSRISVDAALVRITQRGPVDGTFSKRIPRHQIKNTGFTENNVPSFPNGEIVNITATNFRSTIMKVGARTGLTIGSLRYCDAHAVIVNDHLVSIDEQKTQFNIRVHGQIEVIPRIDPTHVTDERQPFLTHGDSGSFVFMIVQDNPPVLRCVGLATAVTSFGSCLMTPIENVLTDLGLSCDCLSKFELPKLDIRDSKTSSKDDVIIEMLRGMKSDVQLQIGEIKTQLASTNEDVQLQIGELKTQLAATNEEVRDINRKVQSMPENSESVSSITKRCNIL